MRTPSPPWARLILPRSTPSLRTLAACSCRHQHASASSNDEAQRAAEKRFGSTLFLPKTAFPLKADAARREALFRPRTTTALYQWQRKHNKGPLFVLHDGPPYANGSLHTGHAMNKILKDIINRFQVLIGNRVHYMPGWDCHGLPIELKAQASAQAPASSSSTEPPDQDVVARQLRATAAKFALETIEVQKEDFKQFGIMADWSDQETYRTLDPQYEANQLEIFGQMARSGLIYRQYRPVHWSPSTKTALAEAELEYNEAHRSNSAYVKFKLDRVGPALDEALGHQHLRHGQADLIVWTTTPWTLPANAAVAVHRDMEYSLLRTTETGAAERLIIVGTERIQSVSELGIGRTPAKGQSRPQVGNLETVATISGSALIDSTYRHPFLSDDAPSRPILDAAFVTASSGTGLVHCAPAHGADDYDLCRDQGILARDGLFSPVDDDGRYTSDVGEPRLVGLDVLGAGGREVLKILDERGALLSEVRITHKYPYDWRSKMPVITRATSQWFANLDRIKTASLKALEDVQFYPPTGRNRLEAFIKSRSEWCISRQRAWGVPLPVLYDTETDEALITEANVAHIAKVLAEKGTDYWWSGDVSEFVAPQHQGQGRRWRKGRDTVDVWFDSGVSWALLRGLREQQPYADLYLEGSDQHRGWFQSSLLVAMAVAEAQKQGARPITTNAKAPFARIATHGFVVDESGKKMSKSIGNVVSPSNIIHGSGHELKANGDAPTKGARKGVTWPAYGTDVLRLWVARSDFTSDVPVGPTVVAKASDASRKLRNTARFMLANLPPGGVRPSPWRSDEPTETKGLSPHSSGLTLADRYIMLELYRLERACRHAYETYDFAQATRRVIDFASGPLSSLYFDITKDTLYADPQDDPRRQVVLQVMDQVVRTFTSILAPVMPHLAEEIYYFYNGAAADDQAPNEAVRSVFEMGWQAVDESWNDVSVGDDAGRVLRVRDAVLAGLEVARRQGHVKSSLAAGVELVGPPDSPLLALLKSIQPELVNFFIVSDVTIRSPSAQDFEALAWSRSSVEDVDIQVRPALHHKCPRCWTYRRQVEEEVCARCEKALDPAR